jgi:serine phosphatase RsbU (regulator of sigma subunit)
MVTVAKSLFMADAATLAPAEFLERATTLVHRMHLGRMAMALTLLRLDGRRALVSSAGMPPLLWFHAATGEAEEIALPGTPLGALPARHISRRAELLPGDVLLLMSDGFPSFAARRRAALEAARAHFAASAASPARSWLRSIAPRPPTPARAAGRRRHVLVLRAE